MRDLKDAITRHLRDVDGPFHGLVQLSYEYDRHPGEWDTVLPESVRTADLIDDLRTSVSHGGFSQYLSLVCDGKPTRDVKSTIAGLIRCGLPDVAELLERATEVWEETIVSRKPGDTAFWETLNNKLSAFDDTVIDMYESIGERMDEYIRSHVEEFMPSEY